MRKTHETPPNRRIKSKMLLKAIDADGGSNRDLAYKAGVSFRAIAEARTGFKDDDLQKTRKRLGIVESMTRLAISLGLDPHRVLEELNISASEAKVRKHVERAREDSASKAHHGGDYLLHAVRSRELVNPRRKGPILGIVPWSPFSDGIISGVSVAKLLARSVLGSLNPEWDREVNITLEKSFSDAEKRLLSDDESDTPECLLGLYDLPWRRRADVEIVTLPGLRVKVGALCTRKITWKDVLVGGDSLPRVLVIAGDVGDKLITGPADYPEGRIIKPRLETNDRPTICRRIQTECKQVRQNDLLFVADGPLVSDVFQHLEQTGIKDQLKKDGIEVQKIGGTAWAPSYRFGFALRRDSPRSRDLIQEAIDQDLIGRLLPRTAYLYLKLVESGPDEIGLNLSDLSERYAQGASNFLQITKELYPQNWRQLLERSVMDRNTLDLLLPNHAGRK